MSDTKNDNDSSDLNLYFYSPSTAAAVIFSVLYFLLTLWHGYINFVATRHATYKHKYTIPLFVACVISTAGWSIRNASIHDLDSIPLYAVSASYIVISPIFVCATLYLLLTRLIRTSLPAEDGQHQQVFFRIRPGWLGRLFITSDIVSFLTQCSGSGIASSGNWEGDLKTVGTNVLLVGLSLQLATFTVFLVVLGRFVRRVSLRGAKDSGGAAAAAWDPRVRKVVWAVWIAGFWIQIRSIYRVVEFGMGIDGYPFTHEWCLYVLEALPMFIALTALALYHPVKYMPQQKPQTTTTTTEYALHENTHGRRGHARRSKGTHRIGLDKTKPGFANTNSAV
ncbi:putative RTA1 domain protein [Fonsecaea pedrosoi]|nr:putative RTA1 domain protein [Fonsecaea pedrosoi]